MIGKQLDMYIYIRTAHVIISPKATIHTYIYLGRTEINGWGDSLTSGKLESPSEVNRI